MSGRITKNELNDSLTNDIYKIASQSELGRVKVDNDTILVDEFGTIRAKANTTSYYVEAKQGVNNNVYELSIPKITEYTSGMKILLKVLENNKVGTVKININNLGEKDLYYQTYIGTVQNSGALEANKIYELVYSGDRFNLLGYPFISSSIISNQSTIVASASAVKELNDIKANKIQESEISVVLQNSWSGNAKYYKDEFNVVHGFFTIYGGITSANTTLFQLPIGYRPSNTRVFIAHTYGNSDPTDTPLHLVINTNGACFIEYPVKTNVTSSFSFRI